MFCRGVGSGQALNSSSLALLGRDNTQPEGTEEGQITQAS